MSLDRAIEALTAEVAAFKQGTADQPRENTEEWFLLRARVLGLSLLRRMQQLGFASQPADAESFYRKILQQAKLQERVNEEPSGSST